jgi:hypothetical protein
MEPEGSLPHSQAPGTCPYPEPKQSHSCPLPSQSHLRSISILSSHLSLGLPSGLTFHVPNLKSLLHCLCCSKGSVQVLSPCQTIHNVVSFTVRNFSTSPNTQDEGIPLVGCPRLFIQCIPSISAGRTSFRNLTTP